jgi:hypothetical protein
MKAPLMLAACLGLILAVLLLREVSFSQNSPDTNTHTTYVLIDLLPIGKAKPARFGTARIIGTLNSKDREALELLVGRVPYVSGQVEEVVTYWSENVVAARIIRGRRYIYCTKSPEGNWQIVSMAVF